MHSLGSIILIHQLKDEGHSVSEIARRVGMDRKTVRVHLKKGLEVPSYKKRPPVASILDPHKAYLHQQIQQHPGLTAVRMIRVNMRYHNKWWQRDKSTVNIMFDYPGHS